MDSSSSVHIRKYHVFPSFHGPDVRRSFLSHLHKHFASKGITMFKDQEIERSRAIGPELVQAIRESRVSIVVLSKKYASSSWCLDELVEILKCREALRNIVMTIFYEIDPSHVRKQIGDFGKAFEETCVGKTEEVKLKWSKALTDVSSIAGEHSLSWDDEAGMIEKLATDVSSKLNVTPSRDFDDMVGLEAHLKKVNSLLCLEYDGVKMTGIWGPAGIGKTTIARALFNQLSNIFRLRCFMGNLKGSYRNIIGVDDYDSKLYLQNQLLSKILNQNDMRIHHLGAMKEWLHDQRVVIILDDVDDLEQLEILAKEPSWFGPGSRIIVTTKDKKILKAHGIIDIYHVDYPSDKEALEILCLSAFKQSSPWDGFEELANKVAKLCGNLPLGLRVVGSSLQRESKQEWELQLSKLETSLDTKIEDVLRVGYGKLSKKDQSLFLHIAFFFNNEDVNQATTMLTDSNLDVDNGLKTLADKSLVNISMNGRIVMHCLLQQLGRQVILEQFDEPGKRLFLEEAKEICGVLANKTGTGSVIGISFDMSKIGKYSISGGAFEGMDNLQFLRFYFGGFNRKSKLRILGEIEYLPRLRLLHWVSYPGKCLPRTFQPECLIELHMPFSKLEKLWGGIQILPNLREIELINSYKLKEIPNLSKAKNLKKLSITYCASLVELPSSISNLHKLKTLMMMGCVELQVVPTNINLASLEEVSMSNCPRLTTFPDISSNIKCLRVRGTSIKDVPPSIDGRWYHLEELDIGSKHLKGLSHVPESVRHLDLSSSSIEGIPDCITDLPRLETLIIENCRKLLSLPSLLMSLNAKNCRSLERFCCSFDNPNMELMFHNCLKLEEEARRVTIQQWVYEYVCLPGKEVPEEFTHKATGNSITIPLHPGGEGTLSVSSRFKACLLLSLTKHHVFFSVTTRLRNQGGDIINELEYDSLIKSPKFLTEHLFIVHGDLFNQQNRSPELDVTTSEILFEFSCCEKHDWIMECGVQILNEEVESSYYETGGNNNHHSDGHYEL